MPCLRIDQETLNQRGALPPLTLTTNARETRSIERNRMIVKPYGNCHYVVVTGAADMEISLP